MEQGGAGRQSLKRQTDRSARKPRGLRAHRPSRPYRVLYHVMIHYADFLAVGMPAARLVSQSMLSLAAPTPA
jgi:hypothetical protein